MHVRWTNDLLLTDQRFNWGIIIRHTGPRSIPQSLMLIWQFFHTKFIVQVILSMVISRKNSFQKVCSYSEKKKKQTNKGNCPCSFKWFYLLLRKSCCYSQHSQLLIACNHILPCFNEQPCLHIPLLYSRKQSCFTWNDRGLSYAMILIW